MSRVCEVCGKGPTVGIMKSHANNKIKKWVYPNLQNKTINGKRVKICTNCLKKRSKV